MVVVAGGHRMECTQWIPKLKITLENYNLIDPFLCGECVEQKIGYGISMAILFWKIFHELPYNGNGVLRTIW